jgi:gliding motility-associated-like protein
LAPDRILTQDTVIFLGNGVPIEINSNCPATFTWFPSLGVNPPSVPNPTIQPLNQGDFTYRVRIADPKSFCIAEDSIRITVVDPTTLDCSEVFLPNTFTPNDDGLNDTYGISNPFAINLISLEIFDRWGARVFATSDPFRQWDGSFKSRPVNPGIFQYRVRFECNGEEKSDFGTLTVMR